MLSKKRLFPVSALLMAAALMFVYCVDSDEPTEPVDPLAGAALCLSESSCAMGAVCDTSAAIDVTNCGNSAALRWTAADDAAWLSVSVTSGVTPAQFCVMADSNRTGAERKASVTVTSADLTDESVTIDVTQPSLGPTLFVSLSQWEPSSLGEESEEILVTNSSNDVSFDWVVTEDEDWLTLSASSGSTPGSFTITADANEADESRTGTVTVTASGVDGSPWAITVEQPCTIALAGSYLVDGYPRGIFVSGDYAYVASGGLQIVDVSKSSDPAFVGSDDTPDNAYDVSVSGDYAYVADDVSGLHIINVSNPAAPVFVGSHDTPERASGVFVSGDYAYVADRDGGLQVIDVSDRSAPTLAGSRNTLGDSRDVYVQGDYAYVGADDLQIVDVSDPSDPSPAGEYSTSGDARGVFVSGDYAYIACDVFRIIDISSPSDPVLAGSYSMAGTLTHVFVSGSYAYVTDMGSHLHIIDIFDPSGPALVESYEVSSDAQGLFVSGDYVYISVEESGLMILKLGL